MERIQPPQLPCASTTKSLSEKNENVISALWECCSRSVAARQIAILFGCFKWDDAGQPEIITPAAIAMAAMYPEEAVIAVTDPLNGLPSKLKSLPKLAELKEALEGEVGHIRRNAERAERWESLKQLPPPPVSEDSKARVDKIVADFKTQAPKSKSAKPSVMNNEAMRIAHLENLESMVAAGRSPLAEAGRKQEAAE